MIRQELNPETCRLEMKSKPNVKDQKIIPDCDNREVKLQLGGSRLGRVPCQSKIATKNAGTSSWPSWISHFTGSFVGHSPSEMLCPPALGLKRKRTEGRKREKFYIYSDVTHTHHLSRTTFHTALCHPPSLTHHLSHHFVTHFLSPHHPSHTISHTQALTHHL